jgi:hypothetical protein
MNEEENRAGVVRLQAARWGMDSGAGRAGKSVWAALGVENKERKGGLVCRVLAQHPFGLKKFLFEIFRSFTIYKFF